MAAAVEEVPVPPQVQPPEVYDFRGFEVAPRGYKMKNKRKVEELEEQAELESAQMTDDPPVTVIPPAKRTKRSIVGVGKESGRPWKQVASRASGLRSPILSTSWEYKMREKAEQQAFRDQRRAAVTARKEAIQGEKKRREAAKERKAEAQRKGAVVQKISSSTAKRMLKSKKQRKLLRTADTT
ncbi:hypothetical protein WJX84_008727 [Apatococcus fuscideae]|uniref:Coiled-coil domain-containing protein 86 n=1 Tax=Apatococcus fuscideae TaxID=2026836 RepID=A0AAW1TGB1_9CHLO